MNFIKKHKIFSIIVATIIALCLWWIWDQVAPHPLGSKMEYLGKEDYGNIFGFDSAPNSIYYYGTNMSIGEITKYFRKATLEHSEQETPGSNIMRFNSGSDEFSITYYSDKQETSFSTHTRYIVSVIGSQYKTVRSYMKQ